MSDEENVNKNEEVTNSTEAVNTPEPAKPAEKAEAAKAALSDKLSAVLSLKEQNPKLFYGVLAVLVLPLLFMMFGGGSSDKSSGSVSGQTIKELAIGQKYVLKSPNTVDAEAKIRLVPVPGTLSAYDDTEEADRKDTKENVCQHLPQGTPVEATEFFDAFGKKKMFVKVKVTEGACKDKDGWVLAVEVQ